MDRRDWPAALLLVLVAVPFHPHWLDFELARRGMTMIVAAVAAVALRGCWAPLPRGGAVFFGLCCWLAIRSIGAAPNAGEAWLRTIYVFALFVVFVWGSSRTPRAVALAALPATLIVTVYGILQALGLEWPAGYARTEAVSSLGNRNVASEFVTIGVVGAFACVARDGPRLLTASAAILGAVYLGLNGSRAGLLTLAVLGAVFLFRAPRSRGLVGAVLLAMLAAWLPAASPDAATAEDAQLARPVAPSTIAVRTEIWGSGVAMLGDAPLAGLGTGQFRYTYPRYRSAAEIELSSFGRRFATFTQTAHNDHLEFAIEGGIVALLLWLGLWLVVLGSGAASILAAAPALALVLLGCARSPFANGPAALVAFACLGAAAARGDERRGPIPNALHWLFAAFLALTGAAIVSSETAFGLSTDANGHPTDRALLDRAITLHPTESRLRSLRIDQIRSASATPAAAYAAAREDIRRLRELDPDNPTARYRIAETAHFAGATSTAKSELDHVLALDPQHVQATLLRAARLAESGQTAHAIAELSRRPSLRLRAQLGRVLDDLATGLQPHHPDGARVIAGEARFIAALDSMITDPTSTAEFDAERHSNPPNAHRLRVLHARQLLARGDPLAAEALAPDALDINRWVLALLAPLLGPLRELPAWQRVLPPA